MEADELVTVPKSMEEQYYELIDKLRKKQVTLSYSSLKEFAVSPRNFIKYKLKQKSAPTEGQIFGSICDVLILEPHTFKDKYAIVKKVPTTDQQIGFAKACIEGRLPSEAYADFYSKGTHDKLYGELAEYIQVVQEGKTLISQSLYDEAKTVVDNLMEAPLFQEYLSMISDVQYKVEWKHGGWPCIGYLDAKGPKIKIDLKYSQTADPEKFEREIANRKYYLQAGMYDMADPEDFCKFYNIVYDKTGNFSVIEIDRAYITYGQREFKYLVSMLDKCIREDRFHESYNFFDVEQRKVYKPKWVKGFPTDGPEFDV